MLPDDRAQQLLMDDDKLAESLTDVIRIGFVGEDWLRGRKTRELAAVVDLRVARALGCSSGRVAATTVGRTP